MKINWRMLGKKKTFVAKLGELSRNFEGIEENHLNRHLIWSYDQE